MNFFSFFFFAYIMACKIMSSRAVQVCSSNLQLYTCVASNTCIFRCRCMYVYTFHICYIQSWCWPYASAGVTHSFILDFELAPRNDDLRLRVMIDLQRVIAYNTCLSIVIIWYVFLLTLLFWRKNGLTIVRRLTISWRKN